MFVGGGGGEVVEVIFGNLLCEFRKFEFFRYFFIVINLSIEKIYCLY